MLTEQNRAWRIILGISEHHLTRPFPFPAGLNCDSGNFAKKTAVGMEASARHQRPPAVHCPECGGLTVRIGYCFTCSVCGWGACG